MVNLLIFYLLYINNLFLLYFIFFKKLSFIVNFPSLSTIELYIFLSLMVNLLIFYLLYINKLFFYSLFLDLDVYCLIQLLNFKSIFFFTLKLLLFLIWD